jgi:hypothetical protein
MEKTKLNSFISKYHLGGLIQTVAWNANGSLSTRFISDDKCLIGDVQLNSFKSDPIQVGISDTDQLLKLLSVLGNEIELKFNSTQNTAFSITLDDANTSVNYMLVVLGVIPSVPTFKKEPTYELSIPLTKEFIDRFIKAKSALPEEEFFTIVLNNKLNKYQAVIGYSNVNSTRISIDLNDCVSAGSIEEITFPTKYFREVLAANKDCTAGMMRVSSQGIANIEFKNEDFYANYILASEHNK